MDVFSKELIIKILAYVLGLGAMVSLFLIYQQKNRKKLLVAKLSADLFWSAHYLCLGAIEGMIPNFIGIFRELVFIHRKDKKWASRVVWPILFILVNWTWAGITFFTKDVSFIIPLPEVAITLIRFLPIIASTFVTVSLWIDNPKLTKIISIPVSLAFLIYDVFIGSVPGMINESIGICSIIISLVKKDKKENKKMSKTIFSPDCTTDKELVISNGAPIADVARFIDSATVSDEVRAKGAAFAQEITDSFISDFEKTEALALAGKVDAKDRMAHVSTFIVLGGTVYMTYYANTKEPSEDPKNQAARLVYAPVDNIDDKTFIDLQAAGDKIGDKLVDMVYDTILMQKDEDTIYVMWTARVEENYYRFYRPFTLSTKTLGEIGVNRFKVGDTVNDFSVSGIKAALAANGVPCKKMYSDIGIMQKLSSRMENGELYYYSGTYSGDFTCIIKSKDLVTWEYVSQPDFINDSKWENATYVYGDKCFYFVRQQDNNKSGFLTAYDLNNGKWERPVEIQDCQSRSDFIVYNGGLYLFHAPIDREHIGSVKIDTGDLAKSEVVFQAKMHTSCFYPFIQYYTDGELAMSYTIERKHIRLARFTLSKYL